MWQIIVCLYLKLNVILQELTMRISPIRFLPNQFKNTEYNVFANKDKNSQNTTSFPLSYGLTNIAFCGKKKSKRKKIDAEELFRALIKLGEERSQVQKTAEQTKVVNPSDNCIKQPHLLILGKYGKPVLDTVKFLLAKGTCLVFYDKDIDSKEIFAENLRTYIDSGRVKHLGFEEGKPFVHINLEDYVESSENAYFDMCKDLDKKIKNGENPILLVSGVRALFQKLDRPNDFAKNTVFKKYPTIFFVDEGYDILGVDEAKNMKLGMQSQEERYANNPSFVFINNKAKIFLPSVNSDDIYIYLTNKNVQKQLLTNGEDIEFTEETIPFTVGLSKVLKYFEDDYYNPRSKQRVLGTDTIPLNKTIDLLRCAVIRKLMKSSDNPVVTPEDVIESLPEGIDWQYLSQKFGDLHERIIKSQMEGAKYLKEKSEIKPKIEIKPSIDKKDKKIKPEETPKNPEGIINIGSKKTDDSGIYQIIKKPTTRFSDVGGLYNIKR